MRSRANDGIIMEVLTIHEDQRAGPEKFLEEIDR